MPENTVYRPSISEAEAWAATVTTATRIGADPESAIQAADRCAREVRDQHLIADIFSMLGTKVEIQFKDEPPPGSGNDRRR